MIATIMLVAQLNLNQPSVDGAMKQLSETADAAKRQADEYRERRQRDETNEKLDDIDRQLQFNGIYDSDDGE